MAIGDLSDAEDLALMNSMAATISANLANYPGITAAMVTAFGSVRDNFSDKLDAQDTAQNASRAATVDKDGERVNVNEQLRLFRDITKTNGVTDANFAALGIPSGSGVDTPTATVPVATVDTSERLRNTINFADAASPNNKRRPRGTDGCEIWVKIDGPPPGNETDCQFLALDRNTPYMMEYAPAQCRQNRPLPIALAAQRRLPHRLPRNRQRYGHRLGGDKKIIAD